MIPSHGPTLGVRSTVLCGLFALIAFAPARSQTVYLAFGDSITQGDLENGDYASPLAELLEDAIVENHGLGGEKTPDGLTRLDLVLALSQGADVLLLMEGTNDISVGISQETTLFNLNAMASKATAQGLETVHATMIPRLPNAKVDRQNVLNQELVQEIRILAGTRQRRLVDNFEMFSEEEDRFARLYTDNPNDPVGHPNSAGYELMAQTFADVLTDDDTVPPVPGLLRPNHGATDVPADTSITVELWDFGQGIASQSVALLVEDAVVAATLSGSSRNAVLTYQPPNPLAGIVQVALRASDQAVPANRLDREIASFTIAGTAPLPGDINADGRADGADLVMLGVSFGSSPPSIRYYAPADLDGDGEIDGADLAILAANFGQSL